MAGLVGLFDAAAFLQAMRATKPLLEELALVDVRDKAERIAERAREIAPVGTEEEGDPHPGAMRDDISVRGEGFDTKGPYVDVGTVEPYGLYVEFGTEYIQAEPFMRPAIAEVTGLGSIPRRLALRGRKADTAAAPAAE